MGFFGRSLQAKNSMLAISKRFEILHSYLIYNDNVGKLLAFALSSSLISGSSKTKILKKTTILIFFF